MVDIVGAGRIGEALHRRAVAAGVAGALVRRGQAVGGGHGAVLVCTRSDDLAAVVAATPAGRRAAMVFTQNGMIRPALAGLGPVTRGLWFLAVPRLGDDLDPGGVSPFTGPRAAEVVTWLGRIGVPAQEVDDASFASLELEKLLWNTVLGLVCEARGCTVGAAPEEDVLALVRELMPLGEAVLGISEEAEDMVRRLRAYSTSIPQWRGAVREWPWRNGWFVLEARRRGVELPVHESLLALAGRDDAGEPVSGRA